MMFGLTREVIKKPELIKKSVKFALIISALTLTSSYSYALSSLAKNDPFPVYSTLDPHLFLTLHRRLYLINHANLVSSFPGGPIVAPIRPEPIIAPLSPASHGSLIAPAPIIEPPFVGDYEPIDHIHLIDHTNLCMPDRINFSISPFGQNANSGSNFCGMQFLPAQECPSTVSDTPCGSSSVFVGQKGNRIELGDLTGRVNMIPLLFGAVPAGQTLPPSLVTAQDELLPLDPPATEESLIDPTERFASLTFPLKYHKRGVRFDVSARIACGFGANIQTGVASICQTVKRIRTKAADAGDNNNNLENDLTCQAESLCDFVVPPAPTFTEDKVKENLTRKFDTIAQELGVDICDFSETSIEEIRFNLFWRHVFDVNHTIAYGPHFLCMPFFVVSGSVSPGKKRCPSKLFSVPFGNDGHSAVGGTAGVTFDFVNTIELGAEIGFTHFFSRCVEDLRIPNNKYQKTLFPFTADATVQPGYNWHFAAKLGTYHFLGKLSTFFQFVMLEHKDDKICLKNPDPAFMPKILENVTGFKSKVANIGFNYDLSPNISLGFLWQAPLSQRNTYRSTTLMFSVSGTF